MYANAGRWIPPQLRSSAVVATGLLWLAWGSLAGLAGAAWGQGQDCAEGFDCYSIPGYITWQELQKPPDDLTTYVPSISFSVRADGLAPQDTVLTVAVPDLSGVDSLADLDTEAQKELFQFSRHVTRDSVFAGQDVEEDGSVVIHAGDLLLPAYADFPRDFHAIRHLRLAGVDSIRALVNLTHMVYRSRLESNIASFAAVVKSPTIYERQIDWNAKLRLLANLFDDDPFSGFVRVDGLNRKVEKRAVVITMDLLSRYPTRLIRFYPIPRSVPLPIAGFELEAHDGLTYKRGQELVDINQPRLGAAVRASDYTYKEGDLPVWDVLALTENNFEDTVRIFFPERKYYQRYKFRSLTNLNYEIAEFEVFGQGYVPSTQYMSRPMPVLRDAISTMIAYEDGDSSKAGALSKLSGGTLGRIFWDEEKVGDPTKSSATVSIQTGMTPEPKVLYRLNVNRDVVPWRENARVIDRRENSLTSGQIVNLDDPNLRASAFDVWAALTPEERFAAQTTTPEYIALPTGNKKDRHGGPLPQEPDLVYWSGFQPVKNGEVIPVPGERPFFQLKIDFDSKQPDAATIISNLRFEHLYPPALQGVTGEIVPASGVVVGKDTSFTYALRPQVSGTDKGFNRIRIETPVTIGGIEGVEFAYGDQNGWVRSSPVTWTELARTDTFFVVGIPTVDASVAHGDSLIVLVHFRGRVLSTKTTFRGQVFTEGAQMADSVSYGRIVTRFERDPASGGVKPAEQILPQMIRAGNVVDFSEDRGDRNSLDVVTRVDRAVQQVVMRVQMKPNPFTPNGDGVNDALVINCDVLRVTKPVPVIAEIYDLSGRLVRRLEQYKGIGEYTQRWDGTDSDHHLVPPGMYVIRLSAVTDDGDSVSTRLVAVAY